jgi:hypothetical protein
LGLSRTFYGEMRTSTKATRSHSDRAREKCGLLLSMTVAFPRLLLGCTCLPCGCSAQLGMTVIIIVTVMALLDWKTPSVVAMGLCLTGLQPQRSLPKDPVAML